MSGWPTVENLKSQIATSSWCAARAMPYTFTEEGVAGLSSIQSTDIFPFGLHTQFVESAKLQKAISLSIVALAKSKANLPVRRSRLCEGGRELGYGG